MIGLLDLIVATAALWRVASLFTRERGPGRVFVYVRGYMGVIHDDEGEPGGFDDTRRFAELFYCLWCFSMWAALPYALLWLALPAVMFWLSLPFALSAGAIALDRWSHGTR